MVHIFFQITVKINIRNFSAGASSLLPEVTAIVDRKRNKQLFHCILGLKIYLNT